jgi:hypothetical protein
MAKRKDKNTLNHPDLKRKKGDLKGFEDVIDMIPGNRFKNQKIRDPKLSENFSLLNLLEDEDHRLKKILVFFDQKLKIKKEFEQVDKLVDSQQKKTIELRELIIQKCMGPSSEFIRNMDVLTKQIFGTNSKHIEPKSE